MPTIYYYAYDHQKPRGGQKSVYRHVDILNAHGRPAFVLHTEPGYRLTWFENTTAVVDAATFRARFDAARDVVVLPEDLGLRIGTFPGRKVILNQNVYYGFYAFGFRTPPDHPYLHRDVIGAIVKSDHNRDYLRFAFPSLPVHRVVNGIDGSRFQFAPPERKRLRIACLPSKAELDLAQVIQIVEARARQGLNALRGVEWVHLRNLSEAEVAAALHEALCLVFLSPYEGLPRLPLEAMLCGAVVACYAAGPVTEYATDEVAMTAVVADVPTLVEKIERVAEWHQAGDDRLRQLTQRALATAQWHSGEREVETVLAAWEALAGPSPAP